MTVGETYFLHAIADPVYYDLPGNRDDRAQWFRVAERQQPAGWTRTEQGLWVQVRPDRAELPMQGWKIHVSARSAHAQQIVESVWRFCVERTLAFKFLRSGFAADLVNSKGFPRTSSGKLVTIYPAADDPLREILDELVAALRPYDGPYILGDLRWGDGPVFVRYGGFVERYCVGSDGAAVPAIEDAAGRLVPDRRGTTFAPPEWLPIPGFLAQQRDRSAVVAAPDGLPGRVESALHFSNAGGVYVAKDADREVILKEARPHSGIDADGRDAISRLHHEFDVLTELADLDFVPSAHALIHWWEHEFLTLEKIEGVTLAAWAARANPGLGPTSDPRQIVDYTVAALEILDRVQRMLAALHARGWVYGDLQPCNLIRRPDGELALIDFEAAFHIGQRRHKLGTPGFCAPAEFTGTAVDQYSLACLSLHLFMPLTPLLAFAPEKAIALLTQAAERFPLPAEFGRSVLAGLGVAAYPQAQHPAISEHSAESDAVRAILASATLCRTDRLYPGDPAQFRMGALSLAYGAAGVLHALSATGFPLPGEHLDWLIARVRAASSPRTGLYDGLHGVAWLLFQVGHREAAMNVVDRAVTVDDDHGSAMALFGGTAGIVLSLLFFAAELEDQSLMDKAVEMADPLVAELNSRSGNPRRGLMFGDSGLAVAFTALSESTGDNAWLDLAVRLSGQEIDRFSSDAGRKDLSLSTGVAGVVSAASRILRHHDVPELRHALAGIVPLLSARVLRNAGLFNGQAGLLFGSAKAGDVFGSDVLPEHRRTLLLHGLPHRGGTGFLGDQQLRMSMDLATGTAGALLALAAARDSSVGLPLIG